MGKKSRQKWLNREVSAQKQETKIKTKKKVFKSSFILIVLAVILGFGGVSTYNKYFKNRDSEGIVNGEVAVIETSKGVIKFRLHRSSAPKTVENFVKLANEGFYDGIKFHRVISDFMIQTGDPLSLDDDPSNDGTGGESAWGGKFEDEINPWSLGVEPDIIKSYQDQGYVYDRKLESKKNEVGSVSMANSGPNTNGSQFFIITEGAQPHLDGKHTVFGQVLLGMDVVTSIEKDDIMTKVYIDKIENTENTRSGANISTQNDNLEIEVEGDGIIDIENIEINVE